MMWSLVYIIGISIMFGVIYIEEGGLNPIAFAVTFGLSILCLIAFVQQDIDSKQRK